MKQQQQSKNHPAAARNALLLRVSPRPMKAVLVLVDGCGSRVHNLQRAAVAEEQHQVVAAEWELEVVKVKVEEGE